MNNYKQKQNSKENLLEKIDKKVKPILSFLDTIEHVLGIIWLFILSGIIILGISVYCVFKFILHIF